MSAIKDCPFCGIQPRLSTTKDSDGYIIRCPMGCAKARTLSWWNSRRLDDQAETKLFGIRLKLETIRGRIMAYEPEPTENPVLHRFLGSLKVDINEMIKNME